MFACRLEALWKSRWDLNSQAKQIPRGTFISTNPEDDQNLISNHVNRLKPEKVGCQKRTH